MECVRFINKYEQEAMGGPAAVLEQWEMQMRPAGRRTHLALTRCTRPQRSSRSWIALAAASSWISTGIGSKLTFLTLLRPRCSKILSSCSRAPPKCLQGRLLGRNLWFSAIPGYGASTGSCKPYTPNPKPQTPNPTN